MATTQQDTNDTQLREALMQSGMRSLGHCFLASLLLRRIEHDPAYKAQLVKRLNS